MVENFVSFGNSIADDLEQTTSTTNYVHVRIQKRTNKKCLTIIEGIPKDIDLKKVLRYFKKAFSCNGTIVSIEESDDKIIQLTGDNRKEVEKFLKEECIVPENCVRVHGS
jgi:translation initiation factor 1